MPTTSDSSPSPPLPPPSSGSTSSLPLHSSTSVKLCSICSLPLLSSSGSELDPFLLRLGDETPSSMEDGSSVPMMCARCSRDRRIGVRGQLEEEGREEEGSLEGGWNRVGALDGFGGEAQGRTISNGEQHEMEGVREEQESDEERGREMVESGSSTIIIDDGQLQDTTSSSLPSVLPSSLSLVVPTTANQPSLDSVVEAAFNLPTPPSPPSTQPHPQSAVHAAPPLTPASATTNPSPSAPSSLHLHPQPPTPYTSTYVLPPRRDPILDLTKRRVPSIGKDCIYPGSTFIGTQKSGRNSYDVKVTIIDVDFPNGSLSGYLQINGLTEDHPVLTTFFEGEIIGPQHGFLTNRWGATETADLSHWQRFPLFRPLKSIVRKTPGWTLPSPFIASPPPIILGLHLGGMGAGRSLSPDRNEVSQPGFGGGAVAAGGGGAGGCFFRFKEKFIISDHRLTSVSGASFSGFYYICVEFSSPLTPPPSIASTPAASTPASSVSPSTVASRATSPRPSTPASSFRTRSTSTGTVVPSSPTRTAAPTSPTRRMSSSGKHTASFIPEETSSVMRGYYFHQTNTEPFQELHLRHVKEKVRPAFEFR